MKLYARARVLAMSPLQARAFTLTPFHRKSWTIILWCPSTAASMNGMTPVLAWAASMLARWSSKKLTKFWWSEYVAWNISVICLKLGLFPEQPASDCLYACPGGLQSCNNIEIINLVACIDIYVIMIQVVITSIFLTFVHNKFTNTTS